MSELTIYIDESIVLPDNDQWQNRFEVKSETSNRVYIVSQHKIKKHWACSCPGWRRHRKCKHLRAIGVPSHEVPYEARISKK